MYTSSSNVTPANVTASTSYASVVGGVSVTNSGVPPATTKKTAAASPTGPARTAKPTPIQLGPNEPSIFAKINDEVAENFAGRKYRWHQLKNFALPRIFTDDTDTMEAIMDWLSRKECEFNSYTERGDRRKAFLLRGIAYGNDDDNVDLIRGALAGARVDAAFQKIIRFTIGFMRRNPNKVGAPIYQVVVAGNFTEQSISAISTIGNFSVRFERMKPSTVIQCHRFQRFAHTAASCSHKYRCVQCVTEHGPGACTRITIKNISLG